MTCWQLTSIWCVVVWVAGDEGATVQTAAEHKLDFRDPLFVRVRFGLRPLVVLLEVVGEISVQIEAT